MKTCPLHVLGPALDDASVGAPLFAGITPSKALKALRVMLAAVGVKDACTYGTHDLRRGHAKDLQLSGSVRYLTWCINFVSLCGTEVHLLGRSWRLGSGDPRPS